jgi:hypothetical protein
MMAAALALHLLGFVRRTHARVIDEAGARDRGDVPAWVLITVMTAGLVTALWIVAEPQLVAFFKSALNAVHGP